MLSLGLKSKAGKMGLCYLLKKKKENKCDVFGAFFPSGAAASCVCVILCLGLCRFLTVRPVH